MAISRRQLLRSASVLGLGFAGLRCALTDGARFDPGGLVRDPGGLLDLPAGFTYRVLSGPGDVMDDGWRVPASPDGMGAFPAGRGVVLVRNHELDTGPHELGPFAPPGRGLEAADPARVYDRGRGHTPGLGGTTTLVYDPWTGKVERQFLSLIGTYRNCSGGTTPWGSWISCEEATNRADDVREVDHGYCFEVPAGATGLVEPVPLRAMGRFNHEAVCVHERSGAVYLTEDEHDGLFYRFLPSAPGRLAEGGRLQALALVDRARADTRGWDRAAIEPGRAHAVRWIDLDRVESPDGDLRLRGFEAGGALFARGEGLFAGRDEIYMTATIGGADRLGQVWRYRPSRFEGTPGESGEPGQLELFVEVSTRSALRNPDNLTIAPWGDLIVCEDSVGTDHLVQVTPSGRMAPIARNRLDASELAGAVFSPDGRTLFVNLQQAGLTLAIDGPWPGV